MILDLYKCCYMLFDSEIRTNSFKLTYPICFNEAGDIKMRETLELHQVFDCASLGYEILGSIQSYS